MTLNVLVDGGVVDGSSSMLQIGRQQHSAQNEESTMLTTKNNEEKKEEFIITDVNIISDRLQQAQRLGEDCKIFAAAALLEGIDPKHFQPVHHDIMKEAKLFRRLLEDSSSPIIASTNNNKSNNTNNTDEWIKQGEQHGGRHDFAIYYKVSTTNQITCRLETPIEPSLLIPILAVLNESELYKTWIPQYKVPRLEVVTSEKLCQSGRVTQTILVETEVPWPIARRELILKAVACDDIDSNEEEERSNNSRILVRIQSLDCEDSGEDGLEILPAKKGGVRIKVDGGFVFEKCPMDHPMAKQAGSSSSSDNNNNNLILLTFTFSVDPKLSILPQSLLNFFLRTAMRQIWGMFLHVAEEVGDGKRPAHSEVIERKREELYDWVEERTNAMLCNNR
jgi:hypothetical protein